MHTKSTGATTSLNVKLLVSVSFATAYGHFALSMMPYQIGALMSGRGLTAGGAGMVGFFEVGALALVMFLISSQVERFRADILAFCGMCLSGAAFVSIYLLRPDVPMLCALAAIAGLGSGLIYAALLIGASASPMADRIYALGATGGLVITVALMMIVPLTVTRLGADGVFLGIGVAMLCGTPTVWGFLRTPPFRAEVKTAFWQPNGAVALIALWFLFSLGTGAIWSFAERVASQIAITPTTVALIFSTSTLFSIAGTSLAAFTMTRIPRSAALGAGLSGSALGCLLLGSAWSTTAFLAAVLLYWVSYMYLYAYLLGTSASIDPEGRVGTAGGAFESLAFALGAPAGGFVMDHGSSTLLGAAGAACCLVVIPICLPVIRRAVASHSALGAAM